MNLETEKENKKALLANWRTWTFALAVIPAMKNKQLSSGHVECGFKITVVFALFSLYIFWQTFIKQ